MTRLLSLPFLGVFLVLTSFSYAEEVDRAKVDDALPLKEDTYRLVFIRMEDQLFRKAGDYGAFCKQHGDRPRSQNRKEVMSVLRQKAADSWKQVEELVKKLEKEGGVCGPRRFWIVNGFACAAKPKAIKELAQHEAISFVYLDRFARPVLRKSRPMGEAQASAMKTLFELWKKRPAKLDLKNAKIPWNLEGIKAPEVWRKEKAFGRGVTVAVIDSGILPTPSLAHALWKNPKESFNGKDDDENGLIDDVFGYDFISGVGFVGETNRMMSHGSSCAGIIAGRPSPKSKWLTGVAPEAELMLLKGSFDLRVLEYLLDQGADLVSMSFMIVGRELGHLRGLYRNAFEHLSAAGVLSMGGAGNFGAGPRAQSAGKQIGLPKDVPCVVAVAGVNKDLAPISFSSKGPCFWENVAFFSDHTKENPLGKPDLTAFPTGYPMWTHPPNRLTKARGWREISAEEGASLVVGPGGNSFSGPHGVGVAALVWSVNPEMNPWEVHALLEETAVDLGPKGRDFRTGAGLLNALAAVKAARK